MITYLTNEKKMLTLDINFLRLITYISIDINVKLKMYIFWNCCFTCNKDLEMNLLCL